MRSRMTLVAALLAVVAVAAGCGGGANGAGSAALGGAASVAPADAAALVAVDTDLGSGQWQTVNGLLAKIPGHDALVAQLLQSFEQQTKLSWANDVKPALGPELDLVVLPAVANGKPQTVVLTQPGDQKALDSLVAKLSTAGSTKVLAQQVGDWTALSDSQAALDAVAGATTHLANDGVYQEATAKLASDALVRAYANGAEAKQLLAALGRTAPAADQGTLLWGSADMVAQSGGLEVDGYLRTQGGTAAAPYTSALVQKIPAGALLVADFTAQPGSVATAAPPSTGTLPAQVQGLLSQLGKVRSTLGGETALYVSPGLPIPSVTLVTHATDPQATVDALNQALAGVGSALGSSGSSSGPGAGGLNLGSILSSLHLAHDVVGGDLVVSTSAQAIADFKGSGQKLAEDGTFKEAQSASGMPAQTTGFVYANLKDALPAVQGLATLGGLKLPAPLTGDLSALRTLTAYGTGSGGESSFTVFLEVS